MYIFIYIGLNIIEYLEWIFVHVLVNCSGTNPETKVRQVKSLQIWIPNERLTNIEVNQHKVGKKMLKPVALATPRSWV